MLLVALMLSMAATSATPSEQNEDASLCDDQYILVTKGDTLSRILLRTLGSYSSWREVAAYNKLEPPYKLEPGDVLDLPAVVLQKYETFSKSSIKKTASCATKIDLAGSDKSRLTENSDPPPASGQPAKKLLARPPELQKVVLARIIVEGNTVFSDSQLAIISDPYLNRPLRFSDLEQLRVDLTRAYTDRGYINTGAVLPNQEITDGQLVYRIVEGRLDDIEVSGTGRLKPGYVVGRIRAAAGEPFNTAKLQESFQLLLDDPLIERMDGQLVPQPETGQTNLKLVVTPSTPWLLNLTADNHGSPSVGKEQLGMAGSYLNPTGYGDRADYSVNVSPGRYNLSGSYSVPISARDTRLTIDFGTSNSTVIEEPLENIDIKSDSNNIGVSLSHPLTRSVAGSFKVGADVTVRDNRNTLLGEPFSFSAGEEDGESRVTAVRLWQDFNRRSSGQAIAFRSSFNFGLDAFGSTVHDDDLPDSEFLSWLGQARLLRNVQNGAGQFLLKANAQYANQLLLPLERFSLGGADSVRGFRKNQLVRDSALFLSAEYQYNFYQSPALGKWKVASFVDYGRGRNEGTDADRETLASAGVGLLWSKEGFSADLYIGHAIENVTNSAVGDLEDDGVHFRFSTIVF